MKARSRKNQRGLSLVEVMIALAIMVFGLGGIMELFSSSEKAAGYTHQRIAAEWIAARKAEEMKAAGYAALAAHLQEAGDSSGGARQAVFPVKPQRMELLDNAPGGSAMTCDWSALLEDPGLGPGCIRVISRVDWGTSKTLSHTIYVLE